MHYQGMDDLKRQAELEPELKRRIMLIKSSSTMYEKAKSLFNSASKIKDNPEQAFILFSRCMHVCNLLLNCEDFQCFQRSSEAERFHKIFNKALDEFERLEKQLISAYDQLALTTVQSRVVEIPVVRQAEVHPIDREGFGNFIKPKQLVEYVDKFRKIVLVLDYRSKKDPRIRYADPNFIRVLPLELNLIAPGLIFNHLRMYIDFRHRPTLSEIQNFDLVVLMGDELENPNATPFKNGSITKTLLAAIIDYNFHNQLKRNPLLIEGGFKAWENAYPMYVERFQDHKRDEYNFSDEFTNLVQMVKKNIELELVYPELTTSIDRPSKLSSPPKSILPPPVTDSTEFPVTFNKEPVSFNSKADCRTEIVKPKFDKVLPQVPTLGGARMDTSTSPTPVVLPPRPVQAPPVPERPSRIIDQDTQKQLLNITHIYEKSLYFIERGASRGNVMPGYTGLVNLGNTCFMNSALQALFNTPGMRSIFGQKKFSSYVNPKNKSTSKGMISACFAALMDSVWSGCYVYIQPDNFLNVFAKEVNSHLADRSQHDSQEFLSLLVDALHEETNRVDVKKPFEQNYDGKNIRSHAEHYIKNLALFASSPINDIFGLKNITQLTCMTCNTSSVTFCDNPLTLLELPVDHGPLCSLRECLKHSFGEDILDGAHRWNCPTCKNPQRTLRSSKIWSFPPVLVICLKRFALKNGEFIKNGVNVNYDIQLDMTSYLHKAAPKALSSHYQLYAVTNHEGSLNSGHYMSLVQAKVGRWLRFDDERVFEIDAETVQSSRAYILFYRNVAI